MVFPEICAFGRYHSLFKRILDGEVDDLPEQAFMFAGTIEDVIEKAKQLAGEQE